MPKKNDKNKAFLMHDEYEAMYRLLPAREAKDIVLKMFGYFKRDEIPEGLTDKQEMFWALVKQHIDEDIQKYETKVETNRANAQKRYATASDGMQPHAKAANKKKEKEIKENEISSDYPEDNPKILGLYSASDFEAAPEEVRRLGPDYYPTREEGSQLPKEARAWYLAHRPSSDKLGGN